MISRYRLSMKRSTKYTRTEIIQELRGKLVFQILERQGQLRIGPSRWQAKPQTLTADDVQLSHVEAFLSRQDVLDVEKELGLVRCMTALITKVDALERMYASCVRRSKPTMIT